MPKKGKSQRPASTPVSKSYSEPSDVSSTRRSTGTAKHQDGQQTPLQNRTKSPPTNGTPTRTANGSNVTQSEINGILWKACDTFRGAVDPSEYKNYILVMLFVKYISDVWQDHYAKLVEEYGDPKSK